MELHNAIWLLVVVFMIHDFEEIISVEKWAKSKQHLIEEKSHPIKRIIWQFWNLNSHAFAKRDLFIFLTTSSVAFLAVQFIDYAWSTYLLNLFLIIIFLHNIVHVLQSIIMKTYTPGLYTAILLVTPYTIYLFIRMMTS